MSIIAEIRLEYGTSVRIIESFLLTICQNKRKYLKTMEICDLGIGIDPILLSTAVIKLENIIISGNINSVHLYFIVLAIINTPDINLKSLDMCQAMTKHNWQCREDLCRVCNFPSLLLGRAVAKLESVCYGIMNTNQIKSILEH